MLSNEFREGIVNNSLNLIFIVILTNLIIYGFNTIKLTIIDSNS